jgi:hypothetical protein
MTFCCGTQFFRCRNPECRNLASQEKQAKEHRRDSANAICRQQTWSKVELDCQRQHFGCGYCSKYFDDVGKFIEHFGGTCRPDRVTGRYQQSRQIRALLQQQPLLPVVEALSLELRGSVDAYRGLWWTLRNHRMSSIIRKLEYGPKAKVDERNPGIAYDWLYEFIRDLIAPSAGSVWAVDVVKDAANEFQKPLPPIPPRDSCASIPIHEAQTNDHLTCVQSSFSPEDMSRTPVHPHDPNAAYSSSVHTTGVQPSPSSWPVQNFDNAVNMQYGAFEQQQFDWVDMVIDDNQGQEPFMNNNNWIEPLPQHMLYPPSNPNLVDDHQMAEPHAATQAALWATHARGEF